MGKFWRSSLNNCRCEFRTAWSSTVQRSEKHEHQFWNPNIPNYRNSSPPNKKPVNQITQCLFCKHFVYSNELFVKDNAATVTLLTNYVLNPFSQQNNNFRSNFPYQRDPYVEWRPNQILEAITPRTFSENKNTPFDSNNHYYEDQYSGYMTGNN